MTYRQTLIPAKAQTLILITRERIVRADLKLGPAPQIKGLWQRLKPDTDDPATLVETAIRLGKKKPGKVVVLSSDLWTQTLRMPVDATRGLSDPELSRALGFEAEPLSGITAFDSHVGFTAMPSDGQHREFWIVQTPSSQLQQIDDAVWQAGGQLVGLGHPAGIARPLSDHPTGTVWQRVELWPNAIVCVRASAGHSPQVHVINADPAQRTWRVTVDPWRNAEGSSPDCEWLVPDVGVAAPEEQGPVFSLFAEESLRWWLTAWAEQLFGAAPGVPLVRPAPRPMSKERRRAITGGLAVAAALVCFGHYTLTERQIADLSAQTKVINDQVASLTALKKQGTDLATKRHKLRGEMQAVSQKVQDCTTTLAAHRLRWQKLLELLAEHRPQHLLVQKIDSSGERLNISGLCLGPHPANELASDLEGRLRELGWRVQPARQEAGKALSSGDPWKFELVLKDFAPASTATAAADPARPGAPGRPVVPQQPFNKVASFREPMGDSQP